MSAHFLFGLLVVLFSGTTVLGLELLAGRLVAPYFGQSSATWAALVGVTLAGISVGNALGGHLSQRFARRPWRVTAGSLLLAGVLAAVLPAELRWLAGRALRGIAATDLRLLAVVGVAFFPLMVALGCITPSVAAATVRERRSGRDLGWLHGASMVGAMLGSLAAGLWLPFVLPATQLYAAFGGLLVLLGVACCRLRAAGGAGAPPPADSPEAPPSPPDPRPSPPDRLASTPVDSTRLASTAPAQPARADSAAGSGAAGEAPGAAAPPAPDVAGHDAWLMAVLFALGWLVMAVELAGALLVIPTLGGSHIVWGLVFATFIGGSGVGGVLGGWLADRRPGRRLCASGCLLLAVLVLATLAALAWLGRWQGLLILPMAWRLVLQIVLPFLPVAVVSGAVSTAVLKHAVARALHSGRRGRIGTCYALSELGAVLGTLATGLVLVGRIPSPVQYGLYAALLALLAVGFLTVGRPERMRALREMPSAWLVATAALVGVGLTALWRGEMPRDVFPPVLPADVRHAETGSILFERESRYNRVTIFEQVQRTTAHRTLYLDRTSHTTSVVSRPRTLASAYTRMIAAIVEVLRPPAEEDRPAYSLLMIGGGGYALPRYWRGESGWRELIVAEIDEVVQRSAIEFMDAAPADWMTYIPKDGRRVVDNLLREGREGTFDLVIGDTINDVSIPYHIVTREFNDKVARLLTSEGVYILHLLDRLDRGTYIGSMLRTLGESFDHLAVLAYNSTEDVRQSYLLLGSRQPLAMEAIRETLRRAHPDARPLSLEPERIAALVDRPDGVVFSDRFSPVERFVWQLMTRDDQYPGIRLGQRAHRLWEAGEGEEALALARRALELVPEQSYALYVVQRALLRGGLMPVEEGLALLQAQARRPSSQQEARRFHAEALTRLGRHAEALPVWDDLRQSWPYNPNYGASWIDALILTGRREEAREALRSEVGARLPEAMFDSLRRRAQEPAETD